MPRIVVTPELASTLKALRVDNGIAAKTLAEHLGKSQSYISKFEKGEIKSILREELDQIIRFIVTDEASFHDKVDEILRVASFRYTQKEMDLQLWFTNYSTVFCKIPLPSELVDDINQIMCENAISRDELCKRINANEFIRNSDGTEKEGNDKFPRNEWFVRNSKDFKSHEMIVEMSREKIDEILDKQLSGTRYFYVLAIVLYLNKIIMYGDTVFISDADSTMLRQRTEQYLSEHNFYSLSEKYKRIDESLPLSIPDQKNQEGIHTLLMQIQGLSDMNVQGANRLLECLMKMLEWNPAFTGALLSLPFTELTNTSTSFKQTVLNQIKEVLNNAISAPQEVKAAEFFE